MKRNELVQKLIKEGMSEKTLVNFSDIQIINLAKRMLGEAVKMIPKEKTVDIDLAKKNKETFMTYEGSVDETENPTGKQLKALDKNKNKKIDAEDFKLLRKGKKTSPLKKENVEVKNWVSGLVESNYHSFTSKGEIMELVQSKMSNSTAHGPNVKKGHNGVPEFMSYKAISKSEVKEDGTLSRKKSDNQSFEKDFSKLSDEEMKKRKEDKDNKLPRQFDKVYKDWDGNKKGNKEDMREDGTKTKPVTKPTTKPSNPKPKTPYNPGPGKNPKPKALKEDK